MEMMQSDRDCDKIRKKVLILSSVLFTVQALGLVGTFIFYWFAQSPEYSDYLAKPIITSLYYRYQWKWLRKEHALELHILITVGIELGLLIASMVLLIGIARRVKCLIIPWLVIFGLLQVAILSAVLCCVLYLPGMFKLLGIGVAAGVVFVIFPWWYAVIHLFAVLNRTAETYGMGYNQDMANTECSCDNRSVHSLVESSGTLSRCQSRIRSPSLRGSTNQKHPQAVGSFSDILSEL